MGSVAISVTVVPEGPDIDLSKLIEKIKNTIDIKDVKEENIGFGLKNLKLMIIRPDAAGQGTDDIEDKLSGIDGVSSVRIDDVTLI
ncbi:MAG: elongation factor 1-beta [Candidatus Aenigmarchaeota archaeon]|nr:elongation factor 1-beta [Candidatus Aenigmarchaeota archaeon]